MFKDQLLDAAKGALRVWVFTTLGLWIPGLLGWINEVTQWADQKGAPAFPDPSNLAYLFVAALTAAFPAALAGIWRLIENNRGFTVGRPAGPAPVPPANPHDERGESVGYVVIVVLAIIGLLYLLFRLF